MLCYFAIYVKGTVRENTSSESFVSAKSDIAMSPFVDLTSEEIESLPKCLSNLTLKTTEAQNEISAENTEINIANPKIEKPLVPSKAEVDQTMLLKGTGKKEFSFLGNTLL